MLQNLATNTFLPDRVFSGWCLSITSGPQDSRLAEGEGAGGGPRSPSPRSMTWSLSSSRLPRATWEAAEIYLLPVPILFCFCHQIFKAFSLCQTILVIFFNFGQPGAKHLGVIVGESVLAIVKPRLTGWGRGGYGLPRCL